MDPVSATIRSVFRELSRLCDGDHTVYLRTDPQTFVEFHRGAAPNVFTSTIAALMPNVVIKLQTPLVPPIISAVPSQQGRRVLHSSSRLFVIEHLSDILDLVKQHRAAFIREDATLAVWAVDVQTALDHLQRVQKELEAQRVRYDTAYAVDPTPFYGDGFSDSSSLDFDSFIHDFDPITPVNEKPQDLSSVYFPIARSTLPPLGTLDGVNGIDSLYPLHSQMLDSFTAGPSNESPMLSDSPSAFMASMAQLHINNTPNASPSAIYSSLHTPYAFSSPSSSAGSLSDSVLSTPMTIAPSVLSSPHTWATALTDSPPLPMQTYDEQLQEALHDSPSPSMTSLAPAAEIIGSPAKRKRSFNVSSEPGIFSEHSHVRRVSRPVVGGKTPASPRPIVGGETPASPTPRSRRTSGKSPLAIGSPAVSERALCPLPGRSLSSSSKHSSDSSSSSSVAPSSPPPSVSQQTAPLPTFDEDEAESSADDHSEYEADRSSDDEEYVDDEFRPSKRSRTVSASSQPSFSSSTSVVRRKATPPQVAAVTKKTAPKKKGTKKWGSSTKRRKTSPSPSKVKPQCPWCDQHFTREGDVERHEKKSCKYYPFDQERDQCPDCGKDVSRHDAMLRHLGSDDCMKRQKENVERAARMADTVAKARGH